MGTDSYVLMNQEADRSPIGANRLIYLPYLMGERSPILDPETRGVFFGLTAMHTRRDIVRAVMEGVMYSQWQNLNVLRGMHVAPDSHAGLRRRRQEPLLAADDGGYVRYARFHPAEHRRPGPGRGHPGGRRHRALPGHPHRLPIGADLFGGMPFQLGCCNGHNTKLNCLEYHRDSEFNLGTEDFILLLAKMDDIVNDVLDTAKVKAFFVPKGVLVEVYATTLHYAPCHADPAKGFRVLVGLPLNTNTDYRPGKGKNTLDKSLWARNKWLLAHPESSEAADGAYVGLKGDQSGHPGVTFPL